VRFTKLSEAALAGAQLRPQAHDLYHKTVVSGRTMEEGTCFFGAAYEAIYGELPDNGASVIDMVQRELPWCPFQGRRILVPTNIQARRTQSTMSVDDLAITLNDDEDWSRESIAAYLAEQGF